MLTVTEQAARGLNELLAAEGAPPEQGVKLVPSGGGAISMTIDVPAEGDEVIRDGERPLLILDKRISQRLDGAVLDVESPAESDSQQRVRFVLQPPAERG